MNDMHYRSQILVPGTPGCVHHEVIDADGIGLCRRPGCGRLKRYYHVTEKEEKLVAVTLREACQLRERRRARAK